MLQFESTELLFTLSRNLNHGVQFIGSSLQGDRMGSQLRPRFNKKITRSAARASAPAGVCPAWPEQLHGAPLAAS